VSDSLFASFLMEAEGSVVREVKDTSGTEKGTGDMNSAFG
jgi:hypothetical protein